MLKEDEKKTMMWIGQGFEITYSFPSSYPILEEFVLSPRSHSSSVFFRVTWIYEELFFDWKGSILSDGWLSVCFFIGLCYNVSEKGNLEQCRTLCQNYYYCLVSSFFDVGSWLSFSPPIFGGDV